MDHDNSNSTEITGFRIENTDARIQNSNRIARFSISSESEIRNEWFL